MVASDSNPFISVCANVLKYDSSNVEIQTDYTLHHDACSSLPHALARSLFCHLCRKFITDFHLRWYSTTADDASFDVASSTIDVLDDDEL
jgi:hypothetical protein